MTKEIWTIEELVSLTENVQTKEIEYNGKTLPLQWCQLSESEEPKMDIDTKAENAGDQYQSMAKLRILAMIEKANKKSPDGVNIEASSWESIPMTLKYTIMNTVMGLGENSPNLLED